MSETVDCIVGLTTWSKRINNPDFPRVLFSIFSQETQYKYKVVLTLSEKDFPHKDDDIPELIKEFVRQGYLSIIWVKENMRAFKKIYPLITLFDVPILTTDDDIILYKNAIETFMNEHKKHPNCILTELGHRLCARDEICTGTFRLFPPDALFQISPDYFMKYFNGYEDDVYLAILAKLKGTKTLILKKNIARELKNDNFRKTQMRDIYMKLPWVKCRKNLLNALKQDGIIKF